MTLQERASLQLRRDEIKKELENPMLGFIDKIELKDELLALEEELGEFLRNAFESEDCENCSGQWIMKRYKKGTIVAYKKDDKILKRIIQFVEGKGTTKNGN